MKKSTLLFTLFILSLFLIACGPIGAPAAEKPKATSSSAFESDMETAVTDKNSGVKNSGVQPVAANSAGQNGIYPSGTNARAVSAMGDPNAPVVIVEYSDYQCPFCRRHDQQAMPQLRAEYIDTGRVYYVFKDFPIASLHPLAYRLHEAALCAGETGGVKTYQQVHDLFFARAETFQQDSEIATDIAILTEFEKLGLPVEEIETCLRDGRYKNEVQAYIQEGQSLGVRGTPTFFINGAQIVGAQPFQAFKTAIEQAEMGQVIEVAQPMPSPAAPAAAPTPVSIEVRAETAMGDPNAPVTIIEYSDYQCPFCQRHVMETMPQLKTNFIDAGRVYYIFKDFPIASLHPLAYRQHEAALCAGEAGGAEAYWQVHDLFFDRAEIFKADTVEAIDALILAEFESAGLPDVQECLTSNQFAEAVQTQIAEARSYGVTGTPAFFINGYPVSGAQPYELFEFAVGLAEEGKLANAYRPSGPNDGKAQATAQAAAAEPVEVPLGDDPFKGSPDAPITIVEYSDYQCPFCLRHFSNTMPQLRQYIDNGMIRYVFKDFPLHNIHPQAQKAHEAARCARELGGDDSYWQMHDLLFMNQDAWARTPVPGHIIVLKEFAPQLGLSQAAFDECLDSGRYYAAVNAEVAEGAQLGVRGTPAFFVNGRSLSGAQPFPVFQQAIEQLLVAES